jgi:hypothetical protein
MQVGAERCGAGEEGDRGRFEAVLQEELRT